MAEQHQENPENLFPIRLLAIFILLATGILSVGYVMQSGYEKRYRVEVERQLDAIADLKVAQLVKWRSERLGDAEVLARSLPFSHLVQRYFGNPQDRGAERQLREWLSRYPELHEYDQVRLLDPRGVIRLSAPGERPPVSPAVIRQLTEVLRSGRVTIVDFYRNVHDQRIYLSTLIPIHDPTDGKRVIGVLALRIDPERYFYPFILSWPTPSETTETVLVRREGDDLLVLNELRRSRDSALKHRVSLEKTEHPAVRAVLGETGIVEGTEARGVTVVADIRAVPGTPWFLVTRINTAEAYAPLRERLWIVIGFTTALLAAAAAGLALAWRHERRVFSRQRTRTTAALKKSESRYHALVETSQDLIWECDDQGRFVYLNPAWATVFGYPLDELLGRRFSDLQKPGTPGPDLHALDRLLAGGSIKGLETVHVGKDGNDIHLVFNAVSWSDEQGTICGTHGTAYDITERKQVEDQILRSLREKEVLLKEIHHRVKNNMQIVHSLLHLQAGGIADESVRTLFEESRNRVGTMALIHEKLYHSEDLSHIDFNGYLQALVQTVAGTYQRPEIRLVVEVEPIFLDVHVGIPCGLIVNELLSNSLKYAFPEGQSGTIIVGLRREGTGSYRLSIADDGIGFPQALDFRNTTSLGLQLVSILTGQLDGTIELVTGKGTRFEIAFPVRTA